MRITVSARNKAPRPRSSGRVPLRLRPSAAVPRPRPPGARPANRSSLRRQGRGNAHTDQGAPLARHAMAYVLAGGRGSRLKELTDIRAKPAVYFGGKIAHHRLRPVERDEFRHPPHRGRHAIQGAQPDPPSAARLELLPSRTQRELRHPAGEPARHRNRLVCRHRRCGVPEHRHHRELRAALHGHAGRRSHLQDGLRAYAAAACRPGRRRDGRLPGSAAEGRHRVRRHGRG